MEKGSSLPLLQKWTYERTVHNVCIFVNWYDCNTVTGIIYSSIKIYRTIILPVVLCGCETWSLTLREERKLRVFENIVLRRIFGPRKDEVTGE